MKQILIIEDNADVREWLVDLVGTAFRGACISVATSVMQAMDMLDQKFDLALIDINLPDGNGLSVLEALQSRSPATYCVMATIFDDDENIFRALQIGAQGYLLKQETDDRIIAALLGILAGEPPLSPHVARRILTHFRQPSPPPVSIDAGLSDRERETLALIAKGMSRAEVARTLGISVTTVATHIGSVYRKLNISSRSEAAVEAIRLGLIQT